MAVVAALSITLFQQLATLNEWVWTTGFPRNCIEIIYRQFRLSNVDSILRQRTIKKNVMGYDRPVQKEREYQNQFLAGQEMQQQDTFLMASKWVEEINPN